VGSEWLTSSQFGMPQRDGRNARLGLRFALTSPDDHIFDKIARPGDTPDALVHRLGGGFISSESVAILSLGDTAIRR